MSNKGETLTDSSDSENERKVREKLRKEQKKGMAQKRKQPDAPTSAPKRPAAASGNSSRSGGGGGGGGGSSGDTEEKISLGKRKFITVRPFKNMILIDIREYYEKDGEFLPGKKGICLQAEQWQKLKSVIHDIDEKIQNLC